MSQPAVRLATIDDLLAIPEGSRFHEIIGGELVEKARASGPHGYAQSQVVGQIGSFNRRSGGGRSGGWWIVTEVEIELGPHEIYRPDVSGWRRERLSSMPRTGPIQVRPDWVAEVLSPSNARNDLVKKMHVYHRSGVPHYWIIDPDRETLSVYRWTPDGFLLALVAQPGDTVRAEPFGEVEIEVADLFVTES
jgi:Uma2 family endonuclease